MPNDVLVNGLVQTGRVTLNEQQHKVLDACLDFLRSKSGKKEFVVSGYAGTGKTSIIPYILDNEKPLNPCSYEDNKVFAYTGKACVVLRRKGIKAHTLHSFLYHSVQKKDKDGNIYIEIHERPDHCFHGVNYIIIDEASMVSRKIYDRLKQISKSVGMKIIFIGDDFQLPPVKDDFNVMKKPDITLTEICRTDKDNPIVFMANLARNGEKIPYGKWGKSGHFHLRQLKDEYLTKYDELLCWTNERRIALNNRMRELLFGEKASMKIAYAGEKMIVKENLPCKKIFNGQIVILEKDAVHKKKQEWFEEEMYEVFFVDELLKTDVLAMALATDNDIKRTICTIGAYDKTNRFKDSRILEKGKGKESLLRVWGLARLDYGYAITVHAAQGSSWNSVALIDEQRHQNFPEYYRWVYTGITRAEGFIHFYD